MSPLLTMKFIAACALSTLALAAFAHENSNQPAAKTVTVKKEQKDWGIGGNTKAISRVVTISMADSMRFTPDLIDVKQGETIKFVIHNKGGMLHELVIGTAKELQEHAALMVKFPTMEHSEPYMSHVGAGKKSEMVWQFNKAGDFDFACLIPGHFQAGMVGKIRVAAAKAVQPTFRKT